MTSRAEPTLTRIFVPAMDCPDEEREIRAALSRVPGIDALDVHLFSRQIEVRHRCDVEELLAALRSVGMDGRPVDGALAVADIPASPRAPLFAFALSGTLLAAGGILHAAGAPTAVARGVFLACTVAGALPVLRRGFRELLNRSLGMNALMSISIGGAAAMGEWEETAVVVTLFALSNHLEARTLGKAREALAGLFRASPDRAVVRDGDRERTVPAEEVRPGDLLVIRAGTRIPVDAVVRTGASDVNEAVLTGESAPVPKTEGDPLYAATVNGPGLLIGRAIRPLSDSAFARILRRVEEAQGEKAPIQTFMDRFARVYTPAVLAAALLVAAAPPLLGHGSVDAWAYRGLVLLIIACPCAIVLAAPVAAVAALTAATRAGVLVKGGRPLETLGKVRAFAFDKTGTLTRGTFSVARVLPAEGTGEDDVVRLAGAAESGSAHPIAEAIRHEARRRGIPLAARGTQARTFAVSEGRGISADVDGRTVSVGNLRHFEGRGTIPGAIRDALAAAEAHGARTAALVGADDGVIGLVEMEDALRPEAKEVVAALRALGIRHVAMLTGDRTGVARSAGDALGITEIHAELTPEGKLAIVREIVGTYGAVAMVGDGVNDAPALALATVGVAMGAAGSPAAIETADVALMADDLHRLPFAVALGRRMVSVIRENVVSALLIKAGFVVLAVAGYATLWMAVAADMGTTLLVVGNGLRLLRPERKAFLR